MIDNYLGAGGRKRSATSVSNLPSIGRVDEFLEKRVLHVVAKTILLFL